MQTITNKAGIISGDDSIKSLCDTSSEPQKSALAGVGSPMNEVVCLVSRLNLARRIAENAAITKAK